MAIKSAVTKVQPEKVNDTVRKYPRTLSEAFPRDEMHEFFEPHRTLRGSLWDFLTTFVAFILLCTIAYQVFTA